MAAIGRGMEADENVRNKLERLREVCEGAKNVRVIIYANPDPDALASAEFKQDALPKGLFLSDNKGIEEFVLSSLAKIDPVFLPVLKSVRR
jgi:hypothetical protein